jgi:hypothetical protein
MRGKKGGVGSYEYFFMETKDKDRDKNYVSGKNFLYEICLL